MGSVNTGPVTTKTGWELGAQDRNCSSSFFQIPRLKPGNCGETLLMKNDSDMACAENFISPAGAKWPRSYPVLV